MDPAIALIPGGCPCCSSPRRVHCEAWRLRVRTWVLKALRSHGGLRVLIAVFMMQYKPIYKTWNNPSHPTLNEQLLSPSDPPSAFNLGVRESGFRARGRALEWQSHLCSSQLNSTQSTSLFKSQGTVDAGDLAQLGIPKWFRVYGLYRWCQTCSIPISCALQP